MILRADNCGELFERSIEDPNNRTTIWAPNEVRGRLDCSICNSQDTKPSWLVTKSTGAADSKRIHVSVTMYRSQCDDCRNQDIKVYILYKALTNDVQKTLSILKKLPLVINLSNAKEDREKSHTFQFNSSQSKFSIVFLSAGSCTQIKDITISYFVCDKNTSNLASLPQTVAPAIGSQRVRGSCAKNSANLNGKEVYGLCSSEGNWKIMSPCVCKRGYSLNIDEKCIECKEKTYKDMPGNEKCIPCPRNSDTSAGKIMCSCNPGFYRLRTENHTQPCYVKTNPSTTYTGDNSGLVLGISVPVALVLAIASVLGYCLWKHKRDDADNTQLNTKVPDIPDSEGGYEEPAKNAQPGRNSQQNRELPPIPSVENVYEEPAEYAQLDSSKRVQTDENYQGLNAHHTKLDRSLNEDVQEYTPLHTGDSPENDAHQELEYVTVK